MPKIPNEARELAIQRAVQSLMIRDSVPTLEQIASESGVSRQYLHTAARKRMRELGIGTKTPLSEEKGATWEKTHPGQESTQGERNRD